ncbi:HAD family hydrolase, partial [Bradyrhizobium sp.]|uniref:HAD family hydrolase n=1 Tax=Bradyrhizobium sp. TaxID=376 RepID=UPI003D0E1C7A
MTHTRQLVLPKKCGFTPAATDLDDTILLALSRPDVAWLDVVAKVIGASEALPASVVTSAIKTFSKKFWSDAERNRIWRVQMPGARREIVAGAFAALIEAGYNLPPPDVANQIADEFTAFCEDQIRISPDAYEVLAELKRRGLKIALVTNGAAEAQRVKIGRFILADYFDHIQIEEEVGFGKPEEQAYLHAMSALGVKPYE